MAGGKVRVAIPTKAECERIRPIIRRVFASAGVTGARIETVPFGGLRVHAEMSGETVVKVTDALFAQGVVIVTLRPGEWRFAIRK